MSDKAVTLDKERDTLHEDLFNSSTNLQQGFELMYIAASRTKSPEKRERLIGRFIIKLFTVNSDLDKFTFSHSDIGLAISYLTNQIDKKLNEAMSMGILKGY